MQFSLITQQQKGSEMATIYKTPKKQVNPTTGKWETVCDADGNPIMLAK